jgi:hypothetical protein
VNPTVIGLSMRAMADRHARAMRESGLACDAGVLADEHRLAGLPPPPSTGIYALDHFHFLAVRRKELVRLALGHGPVERHRWIDREPLSLEAMLARAGPARAILAGYADHREAGLRMLGRIHDRALRRGPVELVLVETPRNPILDGVLYDRELLDDHREGLREFARAPGRTYCDLPAEVRLRPGDFTDERHLRAPAAMAACTAVLERAVGEALTRIRDGGGGR